MVVLGCALGCGCFRVLRLVLDVVLRVELNGRRLLMMALSDAGGAREHRRRRFGEWVRMPAPRFVVFGIRKGGVMESASWWDGFHFDECDGDCGGECAGYAELVDRGDEFVAAVRQAVSRPQWN